MYKHDILNAAKKKLAEDKKRYFELCSDTSNGKQCTRNGAAVLRSRLKRDICIEKLIVELIEQPDDEQIYDEDACLGCEKLLNF